MTHVGASPSLPRCDYRRQTSTSSAMHCDLVQTALGLHDDEHCAVSVSACTACSKLEAPRAARLNAVVSSLVYNAAREIRSLGGRPDCDSGQAWQAERMAWSTLGNGDTVVELTQTSLEVDQASNCAIGTARVRTNKARARIGLIGYDEATGLGSLNRDLQASGAVDDWLVIPRPGRQALSNGRRTRTLSAGPDDTSIVREWLQDFDWVVWAESPPLRSVVRIARLAGTRIACVPMWEWASPLDPDWRCVDLVICPNRHAYGIFSDWKRRFGFTWRVVCFPWPLLVDGFRFRRRDRCNTFLYIHGHGGARAKRIDDDRPLQPRKGLETVLAAAALTPHIQWLVRTQVELDITPTPNVCVRRDPVDRAQLYDEGDVCVQPSRWEGLGLPLLECQGAGMPLITVDLPPMNEYAPFRCLQPAERAWAYLVDGQPICVPDVDLRELARIADELHGQDIRSASEAAHRWICDARSWRTALPDWRALFMEKASALIKWQGRRT